jgi:hypothetical protein
MCIQYTMCVYIVNISIYLYATYSLYVGGLNEILRNFASFFSDIWKTVIHRTLQYSTFTRTVQAVLCTPVLEYSCTPSM